MVGQPECRFSRIPYRKGVESVFCRANVAGNKGTEPSVDRTYRIDRMIFRIAHSREPLPLPVRRSQWCSFVGGLLIVASGLSAVRGEVTADSGSDEANAFLPKEVTGRDFEDVLSNPPFHRSLALSDSIVLTGMAKIDENVFATLIDTETSESRLVSGTRNDSGWQLVAVEGSGSDLESLTAKVQVEGGEVIQIRYEEEAIEAAKKKPGPGEGRTRSTQLTDRQKSEARRAAENYREGFSSDGYPDKPPPEVIRKLSRLSVDMRERVNRYMIEQRNKGLGMEERRAIYNRTLDRALQSRR